MMPVDDLLVSLATDLELLPWDGDDNEQGPYDPHAQQMTLVNFDIHQNPKALMNVIYMRRSDRHSFIIWIRQRDICVLKALTLSFV